MLVVVEEATLAGVPLNVTRSFAGLGSKFVPEIVTAAPAFPSLGVKETMEGPVGDPPIVTENDALLLDEPLELVTPIGPVEAPDGIEMTNCVGVPETTEAPTPPTVTVF